MPSYMDGSFVAVDNTIEGMNVDDKVMYEPINVAYGASSNNFIWFQFVVYLYADTTNPDWAIWQFPNGDGNAGTYYWVTGVSYVAGDTYVFSYTPSGTNDVIFSIHDTKYPSTYFTHDYWVPGTQLLYNWGAYSPASCVEGYYTTPISLTNVPYFQTSIGYGETAHYHRDSAGVPSGIHTGVWSAGSNFYYWSMCGDSNVASIYSYAPIDNGGVSDPPTALTGNQDNNFVYERGQNIGDGAYIIGQMSALSGGNIYVYGYSDAGYSSDLYVYVSMDAQTWIQIGYAPVIVNPSEPNWISVGEPYMGDFKYIAVVGYDSCCSVYLHLDAVLLTPDPEVTILAYDESTSSYVNGIPLQIDGTWVSSGNVVPLAETDYLFQAPDSDGGGAFNCFFDGTNYYGNSADITIVQDTTITAYYNYMPTYSLTINCYDCYFHETTDSNIYVDGNYVGTGSATVQVPIGAHTVTVDYQAYNEGWNDYGTILEIDGNYCGNYQIYCGYPVDVNILVYYDTEIDAVYTIY